MLNEVLLTPESISLNHGISDNILQTIGNTPLVRINRLNPNPDVTILAKLEGFNPTGSIKDRTAYSMVRAAERAGRLKPGMTILEPTSGNTGIALAMISVVRGYKLLIVMSEGVSVERRTILRSFGAEIILTPAAEGTDGAIRRAREMYAAEPDKYFMPDQFRNANNPLAHYDTTGMEIWEQTGGNVDYVVCSLGTSGTIMGISRFMRELKPDIKIVCAQPVKGHRIQGLKNMDEAIVPSIYDSALIDIQQMIDTDDALEMARQIIRQEGIFCGMSSGAAMLAAWRTAASVPQGQQATIVVVFPDRADKYLSTPMFAPYHGVDEQDDR